MRMRTLVVALAVAAPLLTLESRPAAAFGWCGWGWGSSSYGYSAPRLAYLHLAPTATHLATTAEPITADVWVGAVTATEVGVATDTEGLALAAWVATDTEELALAARVLVA